MSNKIVSLNKKQPYLLPLASSFLGLMLGISGVSNHLIFERAESLLKTKLTTHMTQATELSFTGFRTLFLTYIGLSAGLATSSILSNQKIQQKK